MGRGNMHDGKPPSDQSAFVVRKGNYGRVAICFHCRTSVRLNNDNEGEFLEHFDVRRGDAAYYGRRQDIREVGGEAETCPGSGTQPLPLAYKFPDGDPLPYRY
jgi:hypothetical protein